MSERGRQVGHQFTGSAEPMSSPAGPESHLPRKVNSEGQSPVETVGLRGVVFEQWFYHLSSIRTE